MSASCSLNVRKYDDVKQYSKDSEDTCAARSQMSASADFILRSAKTWKEPTASLCNRKMFSPVIVAATQSKVRGLNTGCVIIHALIEAPHLINKMGCLADIDKCFLLAALAPFMDLQMFCKRDRTLWKTSLFLAAALFNADAQKSAQTLRTPTSGKSPPPHAVPCCRAHLALCSFTPDLPFGNVVNSFSISADTG